MRFFVENQALVKQLQGLNHYVPIISVRIIFTHSLNGDIAELFVEFLRRLVLHSNFQSEGGHATSGEAAFDFVQNQSCKSTTAIFRRDSDRRDMADAILFDDADGKG